MPDQTQAGVGFERDWVHVLLPISPRACIQIGLCWLLQTSRLRRHARPRPPPPHTDDFSTAIQRIKGGFSHRLASKSPIWQRGFTDHLVLNREQFQVRRDCASHRVKCLRLG